MVSLCFGVLGGGVLQLLLHLFYLREEKFMFGFAKTFNHPAVRRLAVLMFPQLFGIAVYNLNILVNTQYASFMSEGTVSYLYFAERIIEFPLGVVAVSLATVTLPALSGYAAREDYGGFGTEYQRSLRRMLFIMVPAMVGIVALRVPLCNFLYQHGQFDYVAVINTSQAILGYGLGLFAVGGIRITVPAFFALQDTKTPVKVAFFCFLLNAVCGFVLGFVFSLDHLGLALASSISSVVNFVLLVVLLNGRLGHFLSRDILFFSLRILAIAVIMGFAVSAVAGFSTWSESGFSLDKALVMAASVGLGVIIYFLLARLVGIEEVEMFSFLKRG
ncbi:MAG: oligosaccharide flippase family protein [Candidatus Dadabacteria bacterium]|nr:oligosaccharide flippase family protein [Candidatus Dadabacteria bacterium]